jgi:hypothetical protein
MWVFVQRSHQQDSIVIITLANENASEEFRWTARCGSIVKGGVPDPDKCMVHTPIVERNRLPVDLWGTSLAMVVEHVRDCPIYNSVESSDMDIGLSVCIIKSVRHKYSVLVLHF